MRIQVIGDWDSPKSLRGLLGRAGFAVSDKNPFYTIHLIRDDNLKWVQVDGIDCELERTIVQCIGELGVKQFLLRRDFAMPSDCEITITFPDDLSHEVEVGIMRAMIRCVTPKDKEVEMVPPVKWYKKFLPIILLGLSVNASAFPLNTSVKYIPFNPMLMQVTNFPIVRFWDGTQVVNAGDFTNNAVRVNIVASAIAGGGGTSSLFGAAFPASGTAAGFIDNSGNMAGGNLDGSGNLEVNCAVGCSGSSFADASAFTFGTTAIGLSGFVVDDVGTNTVAENSAGLARMNTNRIPYINLRNNAGTEIGTAGAPIRNDPTGTTTQPISAVSLPLPTGAATAALQTQPGVDIGDVTINNAAGASAVNIQDGGNSITVDGPLTDAQLRATPVPISGTVTSNQGTAAASTAGWPVFGGTVAITTASWTSATGLDTRLTLTLPVGGMVGCIVDIVGTITAGTLNIEVSNDAGANFYPTYGTILYTAGTGPTTALVSLLAIGDHIIHRPVIGDRFSLRLNPVITGAGTANIRCGANAFPFAESVAITQVNPGAGATALGKAEDAVHTTGDTGVEMLGVRVDPTTTAITSANSDYSAIGVDHVGAIANGVHPGRFSCFIQAVTVMTQCQAAPAAGLRAYVTSFSASNQVATVQTLDITFGTGAACATGTTALTHKYQMGTLATTTSPHLLNVSFGNNGPLVPTAANAICVRPSAATAFGATITGFIAP